MAQTGWKSMTSAGGRQKAESPRNAQFYFFCLLLTAFCFLSARAALACPMCSDIVGRGRDALKALHFGTGISWSIALMMPMPAILAGGMILGIMRAKKRAQTALKEKSAHGG